MSTNPTDFSDLDADLDAVETTDTPKDRTFLAAQVAYATGNKPESVRAQDKCRACGGSGKFHSKFSGRVVGDCFRCHGTGSVSKGTNDRVEKTRATKAAKEREAQSLRQTWAAQHPDVIDWMRDSAGYSDFARSLATQFADRGSLSERQVNAVRDSIARAAVRAQEKASAVAAYEPVGNGLDLTNVPAGRYAVPQGETRLKVMIQKPAAPNKWAGWVFVSDAAEYGQRRKYGRQAPGKTYTGSIAAELALIAANPRDAAVAYGKLTGTCAVCGRALEDADSVARGIGPICAERF